MLERASGPYQLAIAEPTQLERLDDAWHTSNVDQVTDRLAMIAPEPVAFDREAWTARTKEMLTEYLEKRRPREQLTEIRDQLSSLRAKMLQEFDIADLILEVGHDRFKLR